MPSEILSQPIFEGRLHPLTLLFGMWKGLRGAIPIIPLMFFSNRWAIAAGMLLLIFAGTVISALARYFSFSYRIEGNELITEQGILARKHRSIPLERVQEIRIEQGVMHRLFNVVNARIETGGGEGAEASLSVLSRFEAERLRQTVIERAAAIRSVRAGSVEQQAASTDHAESDRIIIRRLSLRDLMIAGMISNHLISALVLAGMLWNFADDILPHDIYQRTAALISDAATRLVARGAAAALIIGVLGALAVLVIGLIFSVVRSILLFYGFTFSRRGEDLYRSYGLFTKRASSLPRRRIQVLEIEEKLLRFLFGWATLRADTAGSHREKEDDNDGRDVLIPLVRRSEVDRLLPLILDGFDPMIAEWRRASKLAIRRGTIKGGLVCLLASAGLFAFYRELFAFWPLALLPLVYFVSLVRYRNLGYAMDETYLRTRHGWLGRWTHIIPINKIQAVEIRQTPFDRRLHLATLLVDTAGQAYTGGGPHISNLPFAEAQILAAKLAQKASETRYKW
jgi:putative membrane protein